MPDTYDEDHGLRADNAPLINARFYEAQPWTYFRRRLVHLAQALDPNASTVPAGGVSFTVGDVRVRLDIHDDDRREPDVSPMSDVRFGAAEGEVLLHHVAETLLRLVLAHARLPDGSLPAAPALELARERSFGAFKRRVREAFVDTGDREARRERARFLFGHRDDDAERAEQRIDDITSYLAYLANVFLDSDAYNAAKHGFAVRGERSNVDVSVDGESFMQVSGYALGLLHAPVELDGRRRWRLSTRWYSMEVTVLLIWVATALMENLWSVARRRYLSESGAVFFTPPPLQHVLELADGDPRRLLEMHTTLRYDEPDAAP